MKINLFPQNFKYLYPTNKATKENKTKAYSLHQEPLKGKDLFYFSNFSFTSSEILTRKEVISRMKELVSKKNYNKKELFELFLKTPQKVQDRINKTVDTFQEDGLTIESYLFSCARHPLLFYQSPEKTKSNIKGLVDRFSKYGLTTESCLKVCSEAPQLFSRSPDTIESHFNDVVKKFSNEGLTAELWFNTCIKQPSLLSQSSETIESNIRDLVKKFNKDGLTTESYLKACLKSPQLFYQAPETIESNIKGLVDKFRQDNLSTESYLIACAKQPSLFHQSPELIAQHINAFKYCALNKGNNSTTSDIVETKNLAYSTSLIYLQGIIRSQLQKQCPELKDLKADGIKPALKKYFKENPNAHFDIKILNTPMTQDFISTIQEWSKKDLNRDDVFNYHLI